MGLLDGGPRLEQLRGAAVLDVLQAPVGRLLRPQGQGLLTRLGLRGRRLLSLQGAQGLRLYPELGLLGGPLLSLELGLAGRDLPLQPAHPGPVLVQIGLRGRALGLRLRPCAPRPLQEGLGTRLCLVEGGEELLLEARPLGRGLVEGLVLLPEVGLQVPEATEGGLQAAAQLIPAALGLLDGGPRLEQLRGARLLEVLQASVRGLLGPQHEGLVASLRLHGRLLCLLQRADRLRLPPQLGLPGGALLPLELGLLGGQLPLQLADPPPRLVQVGLQGPALGLPPGRGVPRPLEQALGPPLGLVEGREEVRLQLLPLGGRPEERGVLLGEVRLHVGQPISSGLELGRGAVALSQGGRRRGAGGQGHFAGRRLDLLEPAVRGRFDLQRVRLHLGEDLIVAAPVALQPLVLGGQLPLQVSGSLTHLVQAGSKGAALGFEGRDAIPRLLQQLPGRGLCGVQALQEALFEPLPFPRALGQRRGLC